MQTPDEILIFREAFLYSPVSVNFVHFNFLFLVLQYKPKLYHHSNFECFYLGLRQERPPHLRSGQIHPAMIERGRAIPNTQSVPIVSDKPQRAQDAPQIIDGRVSLH